MQSEVKCKSSYYVYRCATETKLCQCASTLYIHRKSQQTVHEVARVGYFCLSSNPLWTTARFSVSSDTGVKCVAGVSFVTSLVPTTTCPTTPTHYIYQVTVRTSDVARCMQSTDCAPDRHGIEGNPQNYRQHLPTECQWTIQGESNFMAILIS